MELRGLFHGRLLLAGRSGGADDINAYDAACVVLAWLYEHHTATEMTHDPKGSEAFLERFFYAPARAKATAAPGMVQSVDDLKAQMAAKAAQKQNNANR